MASTNLISGSFSPHYSIKWMSPLIFASSSGFLRMVAENRQAGQSYRLFIWRAT